MKRFGKFKKGAASFYIVAISTLILVIIAASFAAVIISEVTRTSNDDLAQSAYDSALAGIEDAKLAYYNYQNCKNGATYSDGAGFTCTELTEWVEKGKLPGGINECDMVAKTLGRVERDASVDEGVLVQESVNNNMQQYYTCVTMTNETKDVLGYVTETNPAYTVRVKFADGVSTNAIKKVRVSWHSDEDGSQKEFQYENFVDNGIFGDQVAKPAVISVGMVQTSGTFGLSDFDVTQGDRTDRGTVYLVPVGVTDDISEETAKHIASGKEKNTENKSNTYDGAWDGGKNIIKNTVNGINNGFLKSNDKTVKNLPYAVFCNKEGNDFACSAEIEIPGPVVGENSEDVRSEETFIFAITLPYGGPSTHFSLEFFCGDNEVCSSETIAGGAEEETVSSNRAILDGVQVKIDSTGRANDLYRRVETRLQPGEVPFPYPLYAIQVLGDNNDDSLIQKDLSPISEWNF